MNTQRPAQSILMGWFIVNVLIPVFAPLAALLPFRLFVHALPDRSRRLLRWTTPVKDGQIAWVGLAFNATTAYDLFNTATGSANLKGAGLLGVAILGAANILIAALGGVFPVASEPKAGCSAWRHYPAMSASVALNVLSAMFFTGVQCFA